MLSDVGDKEIFVTKSICSQDENVLVGTGTGNIYIGADNVQDDEAITAKKNVSIGTDLGTGSVT